MGEIIASMKLENTGDRAIVSEGLRDESTVRRTTVDGVVGHWRGHARFAGGRRRPARLEDTERGPRDLCGRTQGNPLGRR